MKREIKFTGIMTYQQGRGSFDYLSREVNYNQINGLVDYVEIQGIIKFSFSPITIEISSLDGIRIFI